jgi:hypothetical protein
LSGGMAAQMQLQWAKIGWLIVWWRAISEM